MKKFIAMIVIAITLGACSKSADDNYVGKWQMDEPEGITINKSEAPEPPMVIIISKNGDIYKILNSPTNSTLKYCSSGATLQDSKLVCSPEFALTFDSSTRKLMVTAFGTFTKIN